jgi:hypothetical protein
MPKIRKPPPYFMKHLVDRFREGRISVDDFDALQDWLNTNPEVPHGKWYKQFSEFTSAGEGAVPRTFLTPGMVPAAGFCEMVLLSTSTDSYLTDLYF